MKLFGGIEAGGTKFVCTVGNSNGEIVGDSIRIPTVTPEETMSHVIEYFKAVHKKSPLSAIGIATFGPVDLDINSPHYGYITTAPKPGWGMFDFVGAIKKEFDFPIGFDTDVNGAAIGEYRWGDAQGIDSLVYWTVGTGIGAGGMLSGKMMHGLMHPEVGHFFIPHDKERDPFEGVCPYHKDCLEGLATGPAMEKRWNVEIATELPLDHLAWDLESEYLGYAMANCILSISPKKIILGGGIMKKEGLLGKVRAKTLEYLNGYIKQQVILEDIENYIISPGLGGNSGVLGAIALAEQAYENK